MVSAIITFILCCLFLTCLIFSCWFNRTIIMSGWLDVSILLIFLCCKIKHWGSIWILEESREGTATTTDVRRIQLETIKNFLTIAKRTIIPFKVSIALYQIHLYTHNPFSILNILKSVIGSVFLLFHIINPVATSL